MGLQYKYREAKTIVFFNTRFCFNFKNNKKTMSSSKMICCIEQHIQVLVKLANTR